MTEDDEGYAPEAPEDYILYVGLDARDKTLFCPGSRRAIAIVDEGGLRVLVQSVDAVRRRKPPVPKWLCGTPTLVSRAERRALRGTAAIEHLEELMTRRRKSDAEANAEVRGMIAPGESIFLGGETNFEPLVGEDAAKYDESRGKITEADVQRALDRRAALGAVPTQ